MKKYNYKFLIGFILGIILCGGSVYAAIMYSSNIVSYDNASSTLNSNNVQAAIDELATRYASLSSCPSDKICIATKNTLALGDYVLYTPHKTSYSTDKTMTGYTSTQTINPSELNVWRVIRLNGNGTVDIISENVSSAAIYFKGLVGYKNYIGYLNVLASQYETSGITVGSRYFGFNGQTEFIEDMSMFSNSPPWPCSTGYSCTPDPDDNEEYGGGDYDLYKVDYDLVNNALGTLDAAKPTGTLSSYWVAKRYYTYRDSTYYTLTLQNIAGNGFSPNIIYYNNNGNIGNNNYSSSLRPIVTLKSGLMYSGVGTKDFPMEIVSNN